MSIRYPDWLKKTVVSEYTGGQTAKTICTEYGIARSTLFLWKKQYTADETGAIPRERYLLEKELEQLRTENMIFKTCGCSPAPLCLNVWLQLIHTKKS